MYSWKRVGKCMCFVDKFKLYQDLLSSSILLESWVFEYVSSIELISFTDSSMTRFSLLVIQRLLKWCRLTDVLPSLPPSTRNVRLPRSVYSSSPLFRWASPRLEWFFVPRHKRVKRWRYGLQTALICCMHFRCSSVFWSSLILCVLWGAASPFSFFLTLPLNQWIEQIQS